MNLSSFRRQKILALLVSLVVICAYLSVLPTRLTGANYGNDGGDFLTAMLTGGIPHPTGYPTYMLLGWLFQQMPWLSPYARALLLSWLPAGLASGALAWWVSTRAISAHRRVGLAAGVLAGMAWGLSPLLWSQAVIVEVHGLQSLVTITALFWVTDLLTWEKAFVSTKRLLILAGLFGLGLGNHVTLVLFGPLCLYALWRAWRQGMPMRLILAQMGLVLLGLAVYLYLPLRARAYPPINWGNPQTIQGFWWLFSGQPYQGLIFSLPAVKMAERVAALASLLRTQIGVLGLVAAVIGLVQFEFRCRPLRWALLWILVIFSLFSIGYATDDSTAYLVPVVMVASIWLGLSVEVLWELTYRKVPIGGGFVVLLALSLIWQLPATRNQVDPRKDTRASDFAEQALKTAPQDAILLTSSDMDSFPLWYYHFGLRQRSDLTVVVLPLTQFVWYQETLVHTYPMMNFPTIQSRDSGTQTWGEEISGLNQNRPVCQSQINKDVDLGISMVCLVP